MGGLFAALGSAGSALDALEQAMGVVQNNVANASTPGYVTQTMTLTPAGFDPAEGLWGGVQATGVQSARNVYAEQAVWNANELVGFATQQSSSLNSLQSNFSVSGTAGIPAALSGLNSAFSAWSTTPASTTAQQQVITAAQSVAQAFNEAASNVQQIGSQTDQQLRTTVDQINQLSGQIAALNGQIRNGGQNDASLSTQLYNNLEELSNLAPVQVEMQSDGTATVLMGGQTPLVIGQTQEQLSLNYVQPPGSSNPNATPNAQILNSSGQDVTDLATQGQLGGLLQFKNSVLPSIIGDGVQQGSLNVLAGAVADSVNGLLNSGRDANGNPGAALFTYNSGLPTAMAGSLALNPSITAAGLAAASAGPPVAANGTASQLAQLGNTALSALGGSDMTDFYSNIASGIGNMAATASTSQQTETDVLTQAQNMRAQVSGVSLNDQAATLLQFQQGYQAASQAIATIGSTLQYFLTSMQQVQ